MKILAIIGSPRPKGNTYTIVKSVVANLIAFDPLVECEYVFLAEETLGQCLGCQRCLTHGEAHCPLKDELADIHAKIDDADGIILASPIYANGTPAIFKAFIDRHAYLVHRPDYFDKTFLSVITGNIAGYKTVEKQLKQIVSAGKYAGAIRIQNAPVPKRSGTKEVLKKVNHASIRFYRKMRSLKRQTPSFYDFGWFYTFKTLSESPIYRSYFPANQEYYKTKKHYFYPIKRHYLKRLIGSIVGLSMRRSLKVKYDLKTDDASLYNHRKDFHQWLDTQNDLD